MSGPVATQPPPPATTGPVSVPGPFNQGSSSASASASATCPASSPSSSSSIDSAAGKDFVTVVEIAKNLDDVNSEFVTVLSVGDQPLLEDIAIYRAQGERIGMALKFEGGTGGAADLIEKVFVQTVNPDSPAARARGETLGPLRSGDEIIRIQEKDVCKMRRTDCVALLRDAPVCITLHVKRSATGCNSSASCHQSTSSSGTLHPNSKKGPPPPVPPRLSTTTLSSCLTKNNSSNNGSSSKNALASHSNIANGSIASNSSPVQNVNGKQVTSPNSLRKKPPPLPPRRPREPPPAAPAVKCFSPNSSNNNSSNNISNGHSVKGTSTAVAGTSKRLPSSTSRTSDANGSNHTKNKRSDVSSKKQHQHQHQQQQQQQQQPVISEARHVTPEPAQMYMDILDKEGGALESESDDTCSSVSTIIDRFSRGSPANSSMSGNCTLRKTPTIDLEAILAPFQQLEKELDSRELDHKALQKFVDETKAAMSTIALSPSSAEPNYSGVNLDDYDDIASVSPIVSNGFDDCSPPAPPPPPPPPPLPPSKSSSVPGKGDTTHSQAAHSSHSQPDQPVAMVAMRTAACVNSARVAKAKVKEVKLLTCPKSRPGILKSPSQTQIHTQAHGNGGSSNNSGNNSNSGNSVGGVDNCIQSASSPMPVPVAGVGVGAVQVSSLIPKLGLFKSTSSPVVPPRKSRSTGNLSLYETESPSSFTRPSLIPRPVAKAATLAHSSKVQSQSTRDIHMSRSHQVPVKLLEEEEEDPCKPVYNGHTDTEQSDHKEMDKEAEKGTCLPAAEKKPAIAENTQVHHSSSPTQGNVSSQPIIFKEDQHLIKSHSAHDTKVSHHEPDPVSVGDDKGGREDLQQEQQEEGEVVREEEEEEEEEEVASPSSPSSHKQLTAQSTCDSGGEKNESSCSSGEDNTSPILLRSLKTTKVRHDDSGVFSEETDSPSPDCMPAKRTFGPFLRSSERNTCTSAQDEAISCISSQSASSSDPGVASISSDSLTDVENGSENGTEVKKVSCDQGGKEQVTICPSTDDPDAEKDFCPPSVKERIALFQAVVSSSNAVIKKNSKSLYDLRGDWSKGGQSTQNHRGSLMEMNREVYSRSSSTSSEAGDSVPNVPVTGKAVGPPCRRFTSYDPLLVQASPSSGKDNYISSSLVPDSLENRRLSQSHSQSQSKVKSPPGPGTPGPAVSSECNSSQNCNLLNSNNCNTSESALSVRRSSITSSCNGSLSSSQGPSPRASYSMSDLLTPALVPSSAILNSLKTNPPKYSPAFKRRNPDMPAMPSDFTLVQSSPSSTLSSSAINLTTTSSDRIDPVATGVSRQSTSSSIDSCIHLDDASVTTYSDHENLVKSATENPEKGVRSSSSTSSTGTGDHHQHQHQHLHHHQVCKNSGREKGEETTSCLVDSARHFRELAQKWEQRILRDREQSKIHRTPLVGKQGSSTAAAAASTATAATSPAATTASAATLPPATAGRKPVDDVKQPFSSSNGVLSKAANGITGSISSRLWPPDNTSPSRNASLSLQETATFLTGNKSTSNISNSSSNRCMADIKNDSKKSDAFSTAKDSGSIEHSRMSSIDSSASDSGTSSPGYSNASIVNGGNNNCISSASTASTTCINGTGGSSPASSGGHGALLYKDFNIASSKDNLNNLNNFNNNNFNSISSSSNSSRNSAISNLKSDAQYGSVTSLASSTSIISPNELQQLIEDANNSIDGESSSGPHSIQVVVLSRDYASNGPVGISLAGGADCETKEITVHRIITGSIADRDGKIKKGDRVLSINGKIMKGATHRDAIEVLRSPRSEVVLVLSRASDSPQSKISTSGLDSPSRLPLGVDCGLSSSLASLSEESPLGSLSKGYKTMRACLHKDGAGLGFILEGGKDSPLGDKPLAIKKIFKGGLADKEGTLIAGDELISVNDQSVEHMTRTEAWNFLKKLPNAPVHMVVKRVDYGF